MIHNGRPVSQGIAIGEVFKYTPFKPEIEEKYIESCDTEAYVNKYSNVLQAAKKELTAIIDSMSESNAEEAKIFQAHIDILFDQAMNEEIIDCIKCDLYSPEYAIKVIYARYIKLLSKAKDPLIRERVADLTDVYNRLIRIWFGVEDRNLSRIKKPVIVAAHDMLPSDTAVLKKENVLAILTEVGGSTSHTAILARNYGIPAVLGIPNLMDSIAEGEKVIVDAIQGNVHTEPSEEQLEQFKNDRNVFLVKQKEMKKYLPAEPVTEDGTHIDICLNIGSVDDNEFTIEKFTDGIGLFRTEFLYMSRPSLPTEEEQFETYKKAAMIYGERPVIIRTLDIGGDKQLDYLDLPKEDNPFLGLRALRFCFDQMPIFKTQLRACLRASAFGNIWIMFPMVGSLGDIRFARKIVEEVKAELTLEGIAFNPKIKIGIMVEIPSIAIMADIAASEVDFASIGTNDLCQYLTAVDRLNPNVAQYYQSFHPAMFRLIANVVKEFQSQGKVVSVCGEMGGDPLAAAILIGLGMRKLSMNASSVPSIKRLISQINIVKAERIARTVLELSTAAQVETFLKSELPDAK
jgi:phosphotransferase system enzyme I (PtsI)